ncbi:hypothetical protein FISHEDRAFT_69389 [Fistulina hepatica ATCC 64428]|uniref:FAD-binding domain-containing protein n=1 Tax=Fistulina hepatica ATCC 64428 TaxID=1128425 RepID=A0A0D7AMY0_9AGAR|nr:hypothetical protein FISHEDRAFT_69389 [Fistulina hepatica ATCC 64428]
MFADTPSRPILATFKSSPEAKKWRRQSFLPPRGSPPLPNTWWIGQNNHEAVLRAHLAKYGCSVELSTEIVAIDQSPESVTVSLVKTLADGTQVSETSSFESVVGTDGVFGFSMLLKSEDQLPTTWQEFIDRFYEFTGRRDVKFDELVWLGKWRASIRMVDTFQKGRVFVGGGKKPVVGVAYIERMFWGADAAHVRSPAGGQGVNSGMQDAFNLGWKLSLAVKGFAHPGLLSTYSTERFPVIAKMLRRSTDLYEKMTSSGADKGQGPERGGPLHQLGVNYGSSPIAFDTRQPRDDGSGSNVYEATGPLTTGDPVPDALLLDLASGQATSMFNLFKAIHYTVMAFASDIATVSSVLVSQLEKYPTEILTCCIVLPMAIEPVPQDVAPTGDSSGSADTQLQKELPLEFEFYIPDICERKPSRNEGFSLNLEVNVVTRNVLPFHKWPIMVSCDGRPLSAKESDEISLHLSHARTHWEKCISEKKKLQASVELYLAALDAHCEEVAKVIRGLDSVRVPVRCIPDDILRAIFLRIPWHDQSQPYIPSLVCHRWRAIALDLMTTSNAIDIQEDEGGLFPAVHLYCTSNCSAASGLLAVGAFECRPADAYNSKEVALMEAFPYSVAADLRTAVKTNNTTALSLHGESPEALFSNALTPPSSCQVNLSLVHTLVASSSASYPSRRIHPLRHIDAPALRTVQLYGNAIRQFLHLLPWGQITDLTIDCSPAGYAIHALEMCPQLRTCWLSFVEHSEVTTKGLHSYLQEAVDESFKGFDKESATLQLFKHLKTFTLTTSLPQILDHILLHLTAPKLRRLDIRTPLVSSWPCDALLGFLRRSSCSLEELSLFSAPIVDEDLLRILQHVPSVTSLGLYDIVLANTLSPKLLSAMAQFTLDGPVLVPHLRHLALSADRYAWDCRSHLPMWVDMVEARWRGIPDSEVTGSELETFEIRTRTQCIVDSDTDPYYESRSSLSFYDLERLRSMACEGLAVFDLGLGYDADSDTSCPFVELIAWESDDEFREGAEGFDERWKARSFLVFDDMGAPPPERKDKRLRSCLPSACIDESSVSSPAPEVMKTDKVPDEDTDEESDKEEAADGQSDNDEESDASYEYESPSESGSEYEFSDEDEYSA